MDSATHTQADLNTGLEPLPAPRWVLFVVCSISLFSSIGMTKWLKARSEQIWVGRLEAITEVITAPRDAKISDLAVSPGTPVTAGQVLLSLDSSLLDQQIEEQAERIRQMELELQQIEAKAKVELSFRLKDIDDDIYSNKLKSADLLKEKYLADFGNIAWSNFLNNSTGLQTASVSGSPLFLHDLPVPDEARIRAILQQEAAHNASEVYAAQVELLEKRLTELNSIRSDLEDQVRNAHGIPLMEHRLEIARKDLKRLELERKNSEIISPTFGTVGVYRVQTGDPVQTGDALVEVLDRAQVFLSFNVRSLDLPMFEIGQTVKLEFPGEVDREGIVSSIPPQVTETREDGLTYSRVEITPIDKPWPEQPFGTNVQISLGE